MSKTRLDLDSLDDAELLRRGIGAVRAGELDVARGLLEELLHRDPTAAAGSLIVGFLAGRFGWIGLLAAWAAGMVVGDATSRGAGRKRGRQLQAAAGAAAVLGPVLLGLALHGLELRAFLPRPLLPDFTDLALAAVLGAIAAVQRLR